MGSFPFLILSFFLSIGEVLFPMCFSLIGKQFCTLENEQKDVNTCYNNMLNSPINRGGSGGEPWIDDMVTTGLILNFW